MKTTILSLRALAYTICLLSFVSCQKDSSEMAKVNFENELITTRQDCSNCDCSCFVELKDDSAASLELCGTCEGPLAGCTGDDSCGTEFSGDRHVISLTSSLNPRYDFCEEINTGFWIKNTSTTDDANVVISCTANSGTPQTITLSLSPMEIVYVNADGDCEVSEC